MANKKHTFKCLYCNNTDDVWQEEDDKWRGRDSRHRVAFLDNVRTPPLPPGWSEVLSDMVICPEHSIEVNQVESLDGDNPKPLLKFFRAKHL